MICVISFYNLLLIWGPALIVAASAGLGIYLYLSLRVELSLMARRAVTRAEMDSRSQELAADLEALRVRLAEVEARAVPTASASTGLAVNLNRRGQILRLHGKGRTAAEIASDLQISQGEVELLLKVHDLPVAPSL